MSDTQVFVTPDAMTIEVIDRTSPSLEVSVDEKRVTVEGATRPVVNVSYTGGRGPIWLPGNIYDGTSLAAILAGYIGKAQLAQDLLADIDSTITGLVDARAELATAIQANVENGTRIDDVVSRITQAEGTLELSVAKLNAAEANISNAQVFIDDASVRLSAAEGSISNASNYIATQETILSNEWTVKIQENSDGTTCVAGTGLLVYPTWKLDTVYDVDDYSWFDGNAYKAVIAHTASEENVPPNSSYWQLIPYATKSQFGVLAESFFVQTSTGNKAIPFIVQGDIVYVNGDMIVNGLIQTGALSTNNIFTWSVQSHDYISGISGYKLDATTGLAEFNNITLELNHNIIGPNIVPNSELLDITKTDWDIYYNPTNAIENSDFLIGYNLVDSACTNCDRWRLQFANAFTLWRKYNTPCAENYFDILLYDYIEIEPDTKYAFYAYVFTILSECQVDLLIYDSTHTIIERINGNVVSNYDVENYPANALSLDVWSKSGALFTSHVNARYCKLCIRSSRYTSATPIVGNLWTEVSYLYLSKVNASTTELPSWVSNTQDEYTAVTQRAIDATLITEKGGIIVRDGEQRRKAHLTGGDITFYDLVDGTWHIAKAISKVITGNCVDGAVVNLGYFRDTPKITLSPSSMPIYNSTYPTQSQSLSLNVTNLTQVNADWLMTVECKLLLASGTSTLGNQGIIQNSLSNGVTLTTSTYNYTNMTQIVVNYTLSRGYLVWVGADDVYANLITTIVLQGMINSVWTTLTTQVLSTVKSYIASDYIATPHIYNGIISGLGANISAFRMVITTQRTTVAMASTFSNQINNISFNISSAAITTGASTISSTGRVNFIAMG